MEHAAEADLLGLARDRVVNLPRPHHLERLHPVAQVVEHEHEVVVVLEGLALHARDRLDLVGRVVVVLHQLADLVLHEAGQLDVEGRVGLADGFQHPPQVVLVEFRQFGEPVVGEQVGEFLGVAGVVLVVDRDRLAADQERRLEAPVAADDQTGPLRDGHRVAPALVLDDRRQKLDLVGAVAVRVRRVRFEGARIGQPGVGAVHGDAHGPGGQSTSGKLTGVAGRMESVSPDIAAKLLKRDFTNLVTRVQKGGKLTRAERAMLHSMASGSGSAPPTAGSYIELAAILGVTRQSVHAWKKRKDAPKPAANGLHDVMAWREFMRRHDLKGGEPETKEPADIESSLKARRLLADVEERELRLGDPPG